MPKAGPSRDLTAPLEQLVAELKGTDVAALRVARIDALSEDQRQQLAALLEALDGAIAGIRTRQAAIVAGEVKPPPPAPPARHAPSWYEAPTVVVGTPEAGGQAVEMGGDTRRTADPTTTAEAIAVADERLAADTQEVEQDLSEGPPPTPKAGVVQRESAGFHERPTRVVDAVDDARLAAYDATASEETVIDAPAVSDELLNALADGDGGDVVDEALGGGRASSDKDEDVLAMAEAAAGRARAARVTDRALEAVEDDPAVAADHEEMAERGAGAAIETVAGGEAPVVTEQTLPVVRRADDAPAPVPDDVTPGWTRPAELLFDDALRLFRIGDSDGALISLERLLTSMPLNDDLLEFVRVNEDRLMELYLAILGPWSKIPVRLDASAESMPASFFAVPKVNVILSKVDGEATLDAIIAASGMSRLESVAVLSQLIRTKAISADPS